jgi:hypothetical protein
MIPKEVVKKTLAGREDFPEFLVQGAPICLKIEGQSDAVSPGS